MKPSSIHRASLSDSRPSVYVGVITRRGAVYVKQDVHTGRKEVTVLEIQELLIFQKMLVYKSPGGNTEDVCFSTWFEEISPPLKEIISLIKERRKMQRTTTSINMIQTAREKNVFVCQVVSCQLQHVSRYCTAYEIH